MNDDVPSKQMFRDWCVFLRKRVSLMKVIFFFASSYICWRYLYTFFDNNIWLWEATQSMMWWCQTNEKGGEITCLFFSFSIFFFVYKMRDTKEKKIQRTRQFFMHFGGVSPSHTVWSNWYSSSLIIISVAVYLSLHTHNV